MHIHFLIIPPLIIILLAVFLARELWQQIIISLAFVLPSMHNQVLAKRTKRNNEVLVSVEATIEKTYILIHGAWHASWCWREVVPLLLAPGVKIVTPDLPGHGRDNTAFTQINLRSYVDFITDLVQAQEMPVILLGHSMAGVIISQVAENIPEKIEKLIYLAAFIPENNGSLLEEAKKSSNHALSLETSLNKQENEINLVESIKLADIFYNACPEEAIHFALARLQKEPYQPFLDAITISAEKFGKVKKAYIECVLDNAVPIADQRRMFRNINADAITLNTDHSPFFSDPIALVEALKS